MKTNVSLSEGRREARGRAAAFALTESAVLVVGAPVASAAGRVVAGGVERVVAVVRQVASVSLGPGAPAGGRAVAHADLTELVVDLEPLHVQLLHLLHHPGTR